MNSLGFSNLNYFLAVYAYFKIESTNIVANIGYKNVNHRKSKKHCVDTLPLYWL